MLIGTGSVTVRRAGEGRLVVTLTRTVLRRLSRSRRLVVGLELTATDATGRRQTVTRRLTLK